MIATCFVLRNDSNLCDVVVSSSHQSNWQSIDNELSSIEENICCMLLETSLTHYVSIVHIIIDIKSATEQQSQVEGETNVWLVCILYLHIRAYTVW